MSPERVDTSLLPLLGAASSLLDQMNHTLSAKVAISTLRMDPSEAREVVERSLRPTQRDAAPSWADRLSAELADVLPELDLKRLSTFKNLFSRNHRRRRRDITAQLESMDQDGDIVGLLLSSDPETGREDVKAVIKEDLERYFRNEDSGKKVRRKNLDSIAETVYRSLEHQLGGGLDALREGHQELSAFLLHHEAYPAERMGSLLDVIQGELGEPVDLESSLEARLMSLEDKQDRMGPVGQYFFEKLKVADAVHLAGQRDDVSTEEHLALMSARLTVTADMMQTSRPSHEHFQSLEQEYEQLGRELTALLSSLSASSEPLPSAGIPLKRLNALYAAAQNVLVLLEKRTAEMKQARFNMAQSRLLALREDKMYQKSRSLGMACAGPVNIALELAKPVGEDETDSDKVIRSPMGDTFTRKEGLDLLGYSLDGMITDRDGHKAKLSERKRVKCDEIERDLLIFHEHLVEQAEQAETDSRNSLSKIDDIDQPVESLSETLAEYQKTQMVELNALDTFAPEVARLFQGSVKSMIRDATSPGKVQRWEVATTLSSKTLRSLQETRLKVLMRQHGIATGGVVDAMTPEQTAFWSGRLDAAGDAVQGAFHRAGAEMEGLAPLRLQTRANELRKLGQHILKELGETEEPRMQSFVDLVDSLEKLSRDTPGLFEAADVTATWSALQVELKGCRVAVRECKALLGSADFDSLSAEQKETVQQHLNSVMARIIFLELNCEPLLDERQEHRREQWDASLSMEGDLQALFLEKAEQALQTFSALSAQATGLELEHARAVITALMQATSGSGGRHSIEDLNRMFDEAERALSALPSSPEAVFVCQGALRAMQNAITKQEESHLSYLKMLQQSDLGTDKAIAHFMQTHLPRLGESPPFSEADLHRLLEEERTGKSLTSTSREAEAWASTKSTIEAFLKRNPMGLTSRDRTNELNGEVERYCKQVGAQSSLHIIDTMMTASGDFMVKLSDSRHRDNASWHRLPKVPLYKPMPGVNAWKTDEGQLAQLLEQYARRAHGTPLAGLFDQPKMYIKMMNSLQSLYKKHGCLLQ